MIKKILLYFVCTILGVIIGYNIYTHYSFSSLSIRAVPLKTIDDFELNLNDEIAEIKNNDKNQVDNESIDDVENVLNKKEEVSIKNKEIVLNEDVDQVGNQDIDVALNLDVPFTSQAPEENWDQPWQDACEEASVLMISSYYNKHKITKSYAVSEINRMIDWETENNWAYSISAKNVTTLLNNELENKNEFEMVENPTIEQIKYSISNGNPVLGLFYGKELENPNFNNGGPDYHTLIIKGYTETQFITNDPGTKNGKNFLYSYENIMNALHDWNDGFVSSSIPVVLMKK